MRLLALCLLLAGLAACRPAAPPAPAEGAVLFPVQQEGQWGYIDATGRLVIPPQFERAWPFSGNRALVQLEGRFGYIDRTGRLVIPAQFDRAWDFEGGLALVAVGDRYGYVDRAGRYVWEPSK